MVWRQDVPWYEAGRTGFCCECGNRFEAGDSVRPDGYGGLLCLSCGDTPGTETIPLAPGYL